MSDGLRIFVSSTIGECTAERRVIKEAIEALRHRPVLFEHVGARPYPPRPLYLRELRTSNVFVGVYRHSYGWIDPSMEISGIHDEHNLRIQLGLPPLIYVLREGAGRDPRLTTMIDAVKRTCTVAFYDDAEDLRELIQADLTAILAQAFEPSKLDTQVAVTAPLVSSDSKAGAIGEDVLRYLMVADRPLLIQELALVTRASISEVLKGCSNLSDLEFSGETVSVRNVGDHSRTLNDAERQYYAYQLACVLRGEARFLDALRLFDSISHPEGDDVVGAAANAAAMGGDLAVAIPLFERQLAIARQSCWLDAELAILLTLAQLQVDAGARDAALQSIREAEILDTGDWNLAVKEVRLYVHLATGGDRQLIGEVVELVEALDDEGDHFGVARVSVGLSRLLIEASEYAKAVEYASRALGVFEACQDSHGIRVAALNLAAGLSALGKPEDVVRETLERADLADRQASVRTRAFRCNLLARQYRRLGKFEQARELSTEAISLAQQLGDVHIELLNLSNLGNALRDLGDDDGAISAYREVSTRASSAGYRLLEASSTRLHASVLNDKAKYSEAIYLATYAVAVSEPTTNQTEFFQAKQELARAHEGLGDALEALRILCDSIRIAWTANERLMFTALVRDALELTHRNRLGVEFLGLLVSALGLGDSKDFAAAAKALVPYIPSITARLTERRRDRVCRDLLKISLHRFPSTALGPVAGMLCLSALKNTTTDDREVFRLVVALLRVLGPTTVASQTRVAIAEAVCRRVNGLTFKPFADGSAHWTVFVDGDTPVTCTVGQLDAHASSWLACMVIAFVLLYARESYQELLGRKKALRRAELSLMVIGRAGFAELISKDKAPDAGDIVSVTRATDEQEVTPPPINVILSDRFDFLGTASRPSPVELLCTQTLYEGLRHLLRGKVHDGSMRRAIVRIVLGTIS